MYLLQVKDNPIGSHIQTNIEDARKEAARLCRKEEREVIIYELTPIQSCMLANSPIKWKSLNSNNKGKRR